MLGSPICPQWLWAQIVDQGLISPMIFPSQFNTMKIPSWVIYKWIQKYAYGMKAVPSLDFELQWKIFPILNCDRKITIETGPKEYMYIHGCYAGINNTLWWQNYFSNYKILISYQWTKTKIGETDMKTHITTMSWIYNKIIILFRTLE